MSWLSFSSGTLVVSGGDSGFEESSLHGSVQVKDSNWEERSSVSSVDGSD